MDALKHGSLFDDLLQENFIQKLEKYQIVSFYEGEGDLLEEDALAGNTPAATIFEECYHVLQEIQYALDKYKSYGTRSQRTWDWMGYGLEDVKRLKGTLAVKLEDLKNLNADLKE
ncbi:MAG: hypothetical protein Q9165_006198 [Trypethelium subeluteriae]